ncbi:hypothetical protein LC085_15175 [Bacillus tianshenii]|uniref:hypothetical protein n=1 Tax=Sutcliffiella tianshenii TaxID=1463404 RepID=UPI001CD32B0D|nr:hypothetical protein [Bacillus tianshenii]MCA1321262.1 hypothetical protein [Bacillus tianshenii]
MAMCPLCNGFEAYETQCASCGSLMLDGGKATDFLDDYSAYMDIDVLKLVDGDLNSLVENICLHMFSCPHCQQDQMVAVKE